MFFICSLNIFSVVWPICKESELSGPFDSGTLAAECCICCADRSRIVFESGDDSGMPGRGIYKIYSACG